MFVFYEEVKGIPGFWDNPKYHLTMVLSDLLRIGPQQADEIVKMALSYYTGQEDILKEQEIEIADVSTPLLNSNEVSKTFRDIIRLISTTLIEKLGWSLVFR